MVPEERGDMRANQAPDPIQWIGNPIHGRRNILDELLYRRNAKLEEQIVFAGYVVVERGLLDMQGRRDLAGCGSGVPLLPEQGGGGIEKPVHRGLFGR